MYPFLKIIEILVTGLFCQVSAQPQLQCHLPNMDVIKISKPNILQKGNVKMN